MKEFSLSDLNRRTGELTDIAMVEPVFLNKRGRKVLVLMSVSAYEALARGEALAEDRGDAASVSGAKPGQSRLKDLRTVQRSEEEP